MDWAKLYSSKPFNISQDNMCWSKAQGWLGFRNVMHWNAACLGKYAWAVAKKVNKITYGLNGLTMFT